MLKLRKSHAASWNVCEKQMDYKWGKALIVERWLLVSSVEDISDEPESWAFLEWFAVPHKDLDRPNIKYYKWAAMKNAWWRLFSISMSMWLCSHLGCCSSLSLSINHQKLFRKMEKEGFNEVLIEPLKQFAKDSVHLVKKCTKPDRKEFTNIARATGVGFLIMGFIGFFVKLVHIPINNILVGN